MQELQQLHAKLDLLRQGAVKFEQLHSHVSELQQLASRIDSQNTNLLKELTDAQLLIRQWHDFFDLSLDMLCIANTQGYFLDVNPSFMRVLGYDKAELLQQPFVDFVHPDDVDATLNEVGKLVAGGDTVNFENRYRCKDGHYVWLAWCTPAPHTGSDLLYAIARDVSERKRSEAEVLHRASHDSLTGLFNRAALMQHLQQACARFRRDAKAAFALLFIDLDRFKAVNDQCGHHVGDALLHEVAMRLQQHSRDTDFLARFGGDEFVVLTACQTLAQAEELKMRIVAALRIPFQVDQHVLEIGASVGIAQPDITDVDMEKLLEEADRKMYLHKRQSDSQ